MANHLRASQSARAKSAIHLCGIQLFQKTLSKEKQKAHKPRLQGNMGIFETSLQCRHYIAKIFPVALDMDERVRV